jgi:hypothetical protein
VLTENRKRKRQFLLRVSEMHFSKEGYMGTTFLSIAIFAHVFIFYFFSNIRPSARARCPSQTDRGEETKLWGKEAELRKALETAEDESFKATVDAVHTSEQTLNAKGVEAEQALDARADEILARMDARFADGEAKAHINSLSLQVRASPSFSFSRPDIRACFPMGISTIRYLNVN